MTTDTMFIEQTNAQPSATETHSEPQSLLTALVGEKQKYKSVDDLAKAYTHADEFIQQLKAENARLREEAQKAKTLDEALARLQQPAPVERDDTPAQPMLSTESIAEIVKQQLTGLESQRTRETNLNKADKLMKEKFGDKALEVFREAATSEAHKKVLTELAAVDPDKFVALFVGKPEQQASPVDSGSVNPTAAAASSGSRKEWTKAWVSDIRKNDPQRYWSSEFQYKLQQEVSKNPKLYFG